MIVFVTTGYGKNVIGGADIWCNNFIENVLPLIKEDYKIIIDGMWSIRTALAISATVRRPWSASSMCRSLRESVLPRRG